MSVHSHSARSAAEASDATPEHPRHVVTAVLVSHDGARWLPEALDGLLGQERPVQAVIAADTGSSDDSARILTDALGPERVLHLARRTGFGAAVAEAVRTSAPPTPDDLPYLRRPSGWDPVNRVWRDDVWDAPELPHGEPLQWLWLLHDDCAPEPDALAQLLRVVDADPSVTVAGPKLRAWYDRRQLLEAGVSLAHSGRRWTGIDRREQDQGQHDQVRPVLSVSSAGMLIRRDVFDQLGGFDRRLPLMRDDVDLCWRAHSAGHRVLVVPDAVLRHAEAASRERRAVDCAGRGGTSPHRVDKAGAVYTLLANSAPAVLPWVMLRLVMGTLVRTLAYLVGKAPGQALDEIAGLGRVLLRPLALVSARNRRRRPAVAPRDLRPLFPPPGATLRATVEQIAGYVGGRSEPAPVSGGRHGAVESGPGDEDADFLEVEQFSRLKAIARRPAPVLFAVLLLVSLVACRGLLGGGTLLGGALLPAPADAAALWDRHLHTWQPVGTGASASAPPYLAVVAALATVLFGSTQAALTLLLVCSVPLAGLTAYFASRPLVGSRLLRAWSAVAYAFLPAATGALATGRLGTAVLAVLLPLLARAAVAASGLTGRAPWRAVWAQALLLALAAAFTPVVWPLALVLWLALLALRLRAGTDVRATALRAAAVLLTPLLLLAPWSLTLLTSPSLLVREAGLPHDGGVPGASSLLLLNPGGPGTASAWLTAGLLLAALAALLRPGRRRAVLAAWAVALAAFATAVLTVAAGGWAGPATLVYGLALLAAAVLGGELGRTRVAASTFGWRQPAAALVAVAAALAPLGAALVWMSAGADGPLRRGDASQVPAFVAAESDGPDQPRTLVVGSGGGADAVSYAVLRGSGTRLGDADLVAHTGIGEDRRLDGVVANLVAGSGAEQTSRLRDYGVRFVLLRDDAPRGMAGVLDSTPGLTRLSQEDGSALWRVGTDVARVTIASGASGDGPVRLVAAGPVEAHTTLPSGAEGRVLRLAESADPGWQATLDGRPLSPVTLDGWAQGFELPASGGRLDLTYDTPPAHTVWVWAQGFAVLVVLVLALPGRRREVDDDLPEAEPVPAQPVAGEGRRARRLRAAAAAEAGAPATDAPATEEPQAFDAFTSYPAAPAAGPEAPYAQHWDDQAHAPYAPVPDPYAQPYPYSAPEGHHDGAHETQGAYGFDAFDDHGSAYAEPRPPHHDRSEQ